MKVKVSVMRPDKVLEGRLTAPLTKFKSEIIDFRSFKLNTMYNSNFNKNINS